MARRSHPVEVAERESPDPPDSAKGRRIYLRFGAMILTAMALMYAVSYLNTFEWNHVRWSEERVFMVLLMGATMAVVMLGFMLDMYRSWMVNAAIFGAAVVVFAVGLFLVRSETTVQDRSDMSAMIPHHSIAILTSERSEISDVRVCELAVGIIEAQRREIQEMDWLIEDIGRNGEAESLSEAAQRPVPAFAGTSDRTCSSG